MKPQRLGGLDLARVLGIVAIIAGHVWTTGTARSLEYAWHVPIFFVLTGVLWRQGRSSADEVRRGLYRLLVPYAVWLCLIAAVFYGPAAARGELGLGKVASIILGGSHLGRPFSAFWFVTALFVTAVLMRCLTRFRLAAWGVALLGVAVTYVLGDVIVRLPWSLGLAPACLLFVLAGADIWPRYQRLPHHLAISAVGLSLSGALLVARLVEPLDIKQADFGTPVLSMLVAVLMSFAITDLCQLLVAHVPRLGSFASWLALPGIMVILTHATILQALKTPPPGRVTDFVAALVLPWLAALLVQYRIPALRPWLLGEGRRQRPAPSIGSDA